MALNKRVMFLKVMFNPWSMTLPEFDFLGDIRSSLGGGSLSLSESCVPILRLFYTLLLLAKGRKNFRYLDNLYYLLGADDILVVHWALKVLYGLTLEIPPYYHRDPYPQVLFDNEKLVSRLMVLMKGWGTKEDGLDLVTCSRERGKDQRNLGGTNLRFDFVAQDLEKGDQVVRIFVQDVPNHFKGQSVEEIMHHLVETYHIPVSERFALLTRVRLSLAFENLKTRRLALCTRFEISQLKFFKRTSFFLIFFLPFFLLRLLAAAMFFACGSARSEVPLEDLNFFFLHEPQFGIELVEV